MKREYPESPLVGVGAVVISNHSDGYHSDAHRTAEKRVLLIRRGTDRSWASGLSLAEFSNAEKPCAKP